jgi:hypothetical protein
MIVQVARQAESIASIVLPALCHCPRQCILAGVRGDVTAVRSAEAWTPRATCRLPQSVAKAQHALMTSYLTALDVDHMLFA